MSRLLIIYRQRLGDIVGCLPAARFLAAQGHQVDFCCFTQYHPIFETVSYCRPVSPEVLRNRGSYDHIYDLEITRSEYDAYRASGRPWRDYIYAKSPDLWPAHENLPYFDRLVDLSKYRLSANYALAAPMGISQVTKIDSTWFREQCLSLSSGPWHILTARPLSPSYTWGTALQARTLSDLPSLIAEASVFVTINSAPNIIAAGVRKSWYQVHEPGFGGQDNYHAPGQTILHQPKELAQHSWRFWVHYWRRRLSGLDVRSDLGK